MSDEKHASSDSVDKPDVGRLVAATAEEIAVIQSEIQELKDRPQAVEKHLCDNHGFTAKEVGNVTTFRRAGRFYRVDTSSGKPRLREVGDVTE